MRVLEAKTAEKTVKIKKTALSFILFTLTAFTAYTQQYDPENDFTTRPTADGKAAVITKYIGFKQEVSIPPVINKLPVTGIGDYAFAETGLTSITLPNSLTSIEEGAFTNCKRLASINIPNSVISIGEWAFHDCTSLTSINIPNSVTDIVDGAFLGCTSLTAINVSAGNSRYSSQDGVLFSKSKTVLYQFPGGKTGRYAIPNGVTNIWKWAFRYSNIDSVTIPNSVTSIGNEAFAGSSLTDVNLPNSIIIIRNGTFNNCIDLTSVTIPNSVTSIGEHAFQECSSLTSITIPANVTSIEAYVFSECENLTSITFNGKIASGGLNNNAFDGLGDLRDKYLARGTGTYKTTAPVGEKSVWMKQ